MLKTELGLSPPPGSPPGVPQAAPTPPFSDSLGTQRLLLPHCWDDMGVRCAESPEGRDVSACVREHNTWTVMHGQKNLPRAEPCVPSLSRRGRALLRGVCVAEVLTQSMGATGVTGDGAPLPTWVLAVDEEAGGQGLPAARRAATAGPAGKLLGVGEAGEDEAVRRAGWPPGAARSRLVINSHRGLRSNRREGRWLI